MGSVGGDNPNNRIEYEMDFTDKNVNIHHIHYVDGTQEYEIYDAKTGEYIDYAESTNELREIIDRYNEKRKKKE